MEIVSGGQWSIGYVVVDGSGFNGGGDHGDGQ